jgi:hypothetical protein
MVEFAPLCKVQILARTIKLILNNKLNNKKMKKLYNQIEQNLKAGLQVVVEDLGDNTYCAISPNKDLEGNFRDSGWWKSIEKAKQNIGNCSGYSKEYWNNLDFEIVEVYSPEFEPFKVGQKVRLLETIKKTENWEDFENHFPNMTGEIEVFYNQVDGINYRVSGYIIGHEYLAPLVEQEDNVALEAIKVLEEKGYRIIKN